VELVPNPHYGGVPGIPKQTTTVVINWVKTADTALLMLQDGQADSASGLPTSDFPGVQKLQSQGLVNIYNLPTITVYFYSFNIKIDKQLEASQFGVGFNEPSNYFADLPTRLTWINAFDYAGYLNNILGNAKYGTTFGNAYQGMIPNGMIYSPPPDELGGLPAQNLDAARGNYSRSAWANQKITVPIIVLTGDSVNIAAAEEWAGILAQVSNGNIDAKVVEITNSLYSGDSAQDANPMGVLWNWSSPDYPDPSDFIGTFGNGGYYAAADNWLVSYFASLPPSTPNDVVYLNGSAYTQAQVYTWLNGNLTVGGISVDPAVRQRAYLTSERLLIAMGLCVYIYQGRGLWYWRSWLKGYEMQENPMFGGEVFPVMLFYWVSK